METEVERLLNVLRTAMRMLGVANRDIEKKLGVSPSYLSRLFSGTIDLKVEHLLDIVTAAGLKPAEFFHLAYPQLPVPESEAMQRLNRLVQDFQQLQRPAGEASKPAGPSQEEIEEMMRNSLRRLLGDLGKTGTL